MLVEAPAGVFASPWMQAYVRMRMYVFVLMYLFVVCVCVWDNGGMFVRQREKE